MRFRADDEILAAGCVHDETHVVVPMLRLGAARGNAVAVEVEDVRLDDEVAQARFLFRLAQAHAREIDVAIGVAAQLQPAAELAVMREQCARARGIDQPCAAGEVADREGALGGVHMRLREVAEQRDGRGFVGMRRGVAIERGEPAPLSIILILRQSSIG